MFKRFRRRAQNRTTAETDGAHGNAAKNCDVGKVDGDRLRRVVEEDAAPFSKQGDDKALGAVESAGTEAKKHDAVVNGDVGADLGEHHWKRGRRQRA